MTQQPYYPAGPQQPYPGQPAVQQYPQQPQYPAPVQQFPQQPYAPQVPPQQPQVPLAQGSIDDYYSQPSSGGGPSISWSVNGMPKPEGTSYAGIVARDVTNADIQQQTDPKTGQPKFYRDGRPQFVMKVPLRVQPSQEFPDGEATLFVRGQMRDELVRAMGEAGLTGAPRGGEALSVTLVQRKPSRGGGMPQNVFAIRYTPGGGQTAPVPEQPQAPAQPVQQVQQPAQPVQQPITVPQGQPAQPVAPQYPQVATTPGAPSPAPGVSPSPDATQQVQQPQPPAGMSPEQAALLARITGQGAQGQQSA